MLSKSDAIQALCQSPFVHFLSYLYLAQNGIHVVIIRLPFNHPEFNPKSHNEYICKVFIANGVLKCMTFDTHKHFL